jgi:hypothetical protein
VRRHVAADAREELARISAGGLDEEGDPRRATMGGEGMALTKNLTFGASYL